MKSFYIGHSHIYYMGLAISNKNIETFGKGGIYIKMMELNQIDKHIGKVHHLHIHIGDNDIITINKNGSIIGQQIVDIALKYENKFPVITVGEMFPRLKNTIHTKVIPYMKTCDDVNRYLEYNLRSYNDIITVPYPYKLSQTKYFHEDGAHLKPEGYVVFNKYLRNLAFKILQNN